MSAVILEIATEQTRRPGAYSLDLPFAGTLTANTPAMGCFRQ